MTKKKKEEEVIKEKSTHMSHEQLCRRNDSENRYVILGIEQKTIEMERMKIEKEMDLFSANYTLKKKELTELNRKLLEHKEQLKVRLVEHKLLNDKLKEELGIVSDTWGYDPITLEIKE